MVWTWCAKEHTHRDHRQAQPRDQRGVRRSEDDASDRRARRHTACRLPRRLRQTDRRRNREMGQGDPGGQYQAGMTGPLRVLAAKDTVLSSCDSFVSALVAPFLPPPWFLPRKAPVIPAKAKSPARFLECEHALLYWRW